MSDEIKDMVGQVGELLTEPVNTEVLNEPNEITDSESIIDPEDKKEDIIPPIVESPVGDSPTDKIQTTPPKDTSSVEPPTTLVVEPTELETLKAQNEALLRTVEELSGRTPSKVSNNVESAAPVMQTPIVPSQSGDSEEAITKLFTDLNFDAIMESKENFVNFMTQVIKTTREVTRDETAQKVLKSIPSVVGTYVNQQATMKDVANAFYTDHPELKPVKRYVASVAEQIAHQNPEWKLPEVLAEAAKVTKENLKIVAAIKAEEKTTAIAPALPGSTGARKPVMVPKGLQTEINDLIN
jgi:hypothetical protein